MGPRFLDFSKGGKQTPLGLPGSGLSYRSTRRPWGHAGAGAGARPVLAAIIALAVVGAVVLAAQ
jgi:hypothetical protein